MDTKVSDLYDAVGNDAHLGDALDAMRLELDADTMVLVCNRMDGPEACRHIVSRGVSDASLIEYEHHFHRHDLWVQAAIEKGWVRAGTVTCSDRLLPRRELEASYFWRAFLQRHDTVDSLSAIVEHPPEADALTFVTFHRRSGQARFGEREVLRLRAWQPHLANSFRLHRRLAPSLAFGRTLGQVFQACPQPMFVLSGEGLMSESNPAFARWQLGAGTLLRQGLGGRVECCIGGVWTGLAQAIAPVLEGAEPGVAVGLSGTDGAVVAQLACRAVQPTFMEPVAHRPHGAIVAVEATESGAPARIGDDQLARVRQLERQRIMRDLHDGVGSQLVGLKGLLARCAPGDQALLEQVDNALDEMRLAVDALQPSAQDLEALLGMLRYRIAPRMQAAGVVLGWDLPEQVSGFRVAPEHVFHLQRIVLEALTNVLKHADATHAVLRLRNRSDGVAGMVVEIEDNGAGLAQGARRGVGLGLENMHERARALGASLHIGSLPAGGTRVRLSLNQPA